MKSISLLMLILLAFLPSAVQAQYNEPENTVWATGNLSGVDFSGPDPIPITSSIITGEGSTSVCDRDGRLLFYTNGSSIWNAAGALMAHGTDITGAGPQSTISSTQAALIVPGMERCGVYYLFSLASNGVSTGLYCSRVDMNLSNGQGDVDTAYVLNKILLKQPLSEKIIAVKGRENEVWVVAHAPSQARFYAYRISVSGVDTAAVASDAGLGGNYFSGVMKASPQGNKLITCKPSGNLELYDFNASAGTVSNARLIDTLHAYGGVFSPDGSKVYAHNMLDGGIVQYDLNQPNPGQAKVVVGYGISMSDLKLAVNHKIYFNKSMGLSYAYMGSIEAPNNAGAACLFRDSVSSLIFPMINLGQPRLTVGFPNDVVVGQVPPLPSNGVVSDRKLCSFPAGGMSLQARSGFYGYQWDNGTSNVSRTIAVPGTYWVRYNTFCGPQTDTFKIASPGLPPLSISYNQPVLTTNNSYTSYQWYFGGLPIAGANQPSYTATANGWYSVLVKKDLLCSDSAAYQVSGLVVGINSPSGKTGIAVYPNPVRDMLYIKTTEKVTLSLYSPEGRLLLHAPAANSLSTKALSSGLYFLQIRNKEGVLLQTEKILKQE